MKHSKVKVAKPNALVHFAIWLVLFIILLSVGMRHYFSVFDFAENAEAQTAVQNFAQSVSSLHNEWLLKGKPQRIHMKSLDAQGNPDKDWLIFMNRDGWPINVLDGTQVPDCTALWYALQKSDRLKFQSRLLKYYRNGVGELVSDRTQGSEVWLCQNILASKLHFSYRLDTGKVEILTGID